MTDPLWEVLQILRQLGMGNGFVFPSPRGASKGHNIKIALDGTFFRQQMDSSSLSEDTSFLLLSSDSNEKENHYCEVMEFLTTVLAPLMTTNQSVGGWTSFSSGKLLGAGSYALDKDGVEVPIRRPFSIQSFDMELRKVCEWNGLSDISSYSIRRT